ncbi:MAG: hypothetical protein HYY04_02210 [Chloroflexi bacterium]|nr:hypothetical protein [Chloroflexota bacterium]
MPRDDDARYDEQLLLVIAVAGTVLFAFFAVTPVLRPYYALLMPAVIAVGAMGSWVLLRSGRRRAQLGEGKG